MRGLSGLDTLTGLSHSAEVFENRISVNLGKGISGFFGRKAVVLKDTVVALLIHRSIDRQNSQMIPPKPAQSMSQATVPNWI